jgi:hypothetical protein
MQLVVDLRFSNQLILFLLCYVILNYAIIALPSAQPAGQAHILGGKGSDGTSSPWKPDPKINAITQDYG